MGANQSNNLEYDRPHDVIWHKKEYVITDTGNRRIVGYNPSNGARRTICSIPGSLLYGLASLSDPDKGFLVADYTSGRVYRIDESGRKYGWGLDLNSPSGIAVRNGEAFVADFKTNLIEVFTESGEFRRNFGKSYLTGPCSIAMNSKGHLYVADSENINVFTTNGDHIDHFKIQTENKTWLYRGVAIDKNDNVYVTARNYRANLAWALDTITYLDSEHKHVRDITAGQTTYHYLRGLCVNHDRNELAVVDGEHHCLKFADLLRN